MLVNHVGSLDILGGLDQNLTSRDLTCNMEDNLENRFIGCGDRVGGGGGGGGEVNGGVGCGGPKPVLFRRGSLPCHHFVDVVLVLDCRELNKKNDRNFVKNKLESLGVVCQVRQLDLGDMIWIGRTSTGEEIVLDYIIERKCVSDLCSSIVDGRYREQKFRLMKCGIKKKIYLVEGSLETQSSGHFITQEVLNSSLLSTQLDGFLVLRTKNTLGTIKTLVGIDQLLKKKYMLGVWEPKSLDERLYTFQEFSENNKKNAQLTTSQLFAKQLVLLQGISSDRASAIIEVYPTAKLLIDAYGRSDNPEKMLENLTTTTVNGHVKKIGNSASALVCNFYFSEKYPSDV
eukprot:TRINITY_DN6595_c0_g1_i1.p1 TRINITY_DN6595_c0_g1~~TRINITY_DN6595_c0_g1_i1.p1  ORF type:complete len:344 (+),score=81.90 TRINITY_DN6595_c0_g1_i1:929-1960(+)